jgi:hypothetical protein
MDTASLQINGSYLAYAYLALLQLAIVYLQRPDQTRLLGHESALPRFYSTAMGSVGTGLNWFSWLFSAYIASEFGIPSGVLFFVVGMGTSILANIVIPRLQAVDRIGHVISIPATVILARGILLGTGLPTAF